MGRRLAQAGVPCEVRYRLVPGKLNSDYKELWIELDYRLQWACSLVGMHCAAGSN